MKAKHRTHRAEPQTEPQKPKQIHRAEPLQIQNPQRAEAKSHGNRTPTERAEPLKRAIRETNKKPDLVKIGL